MHYFRSGKRVRHWLCGPWEISEETDLDVWEMYLGSQLGRQKRAAKTKVIVSHAKT